jgi:hypothetical protein
MDERAGSWAWFEASSGHDEDEGETKAIFDLIGRLERGVLM